MTEERRRRIEELFGELCDLAPEHWAARLDGACGDDPALKSEVLSLLREDGPTDSFLTVDEAGPEARLAKLLTRMPSEQPPREIAGYKVHGVLGRGSMGVVYKAEQARPHRYVALKLCAAGLVSQRERRRFEREAEILGRLHHPGIAQIHEWGLVDDANGPQPYLVLELVDGRPLVRWADEHRLDLVARLELFVRVCAAVQHAHQQGVIHRDLKPSNILVTDAGQPKVLDFGIARSLDAGALQTLEGAAVIGTLAYMSPEQAEGRTDELDTRTDIHALGVLLHELLTGRLPYDVAGKPIHVALRILIGEEPRKLHEHAPGLRGDLDHIVAKALEKDPERRYSSAQALAEEIGRTLRGEPILARPGTTAYQLRKWVGRNRALAGGIATTCVALVAGLVVALILKNRSDLNAERARAGAEDVLRLSDLQDLEDLVARANGLWPAHPQNLARYREWLRDAEELVARLPLHETKLAQLRARAVPWTAQQVAEARARHPRLAELARARRELTYRRGLRAGLDTLELPREPTPGEAGVDLASLPDDASVLNEFAWPLVDPARSDFGEEGNGLVLARRALELAADLPASVRAPIRDTLAWALFANGRFDEAVAEEEEALEEAGEPLRSAFESLLEKLTRAIEDEISPEGIARETQRLARLETLVAELESEVSRPPGWNLTDKLDRWWHNQLEELVQGLRALADGGTGLVSLGTSPEHGWGIERRVEFAATIEERTVSAPEASARWAEALASLADPADSPLYGGLRITPQLGLLPIGRDPRSGLWEFAHLQTGEPALRDRDGKLALREETGLVFVLLPGGTFWMGAQKSDPDGRNYDPEARPAEGPVHAVTLSPFFMSKYEMTQAQWQRFTGSNPSCLGPDQYVTQWNSIGKGWSGLHPVEQVNWSGAVETLRRLALSLPTEAQWEYACRAGTQTVFWTGDEAPDLRGAANLSDAYGKAHGNDWPIWEPWLDDGQSAHAEVGSYLPNPFGLHDVHGNVWELCLDGWDPNFYRRGAAKDPLCRPEETFDRANRGGSWGTAATHARSACRDPYSPLGFDRFLGLRPARALTPP